jgi:hypothetical protein
VNRTELEAFVENLATEHNIDFAADPLPMGVLPRYDRTPDTPSAALGDTEVINKRCNVGLMEGSPDAATIEMFIVAQPGHAYYRLPFRSLGGDVYEWGLAAFS